MHAEELEDRLSKIVYLCGWGIIEVDVNIYEYTIFSPLLVSSSSSHAHWIQYC